MASLRLRCPACGAEYRLDEATRATDLLALDRAAAAFGADWPLVKEYLDCFRSAGGDACLTKVRAAKRLRLAREIWKMWEAGNFSIGGVWYRIGRPEFREALRATCNQVSPGLTNHNYLKKVLVAAASMTSQREERELREREEGLRATEGSRTTGCKPVQPGGGEPEDPGYRAELARLGRAVRQAKGPEGREAAKAAMNVFIKERAT